MKAFNKVPHLIHDQGTNVIHEPVGQLPPYRGPHTSLPADRAAGGVQSWERSVCNFHGDDIRSGPRHARCGHCL